MEITDLPVGKWTRDYKTWLEAELCQKEEAVEELREHHAENRVHFALTLAPKLAGLDDAALIKKFKLAGSIPASNLVLFDAEGKIQKYAGPGDILKEFFGLR